MRETHTVIVNGRKYDAVTGLAVESPTAETHVPNFDQAKKITHSQNVHTTTQRSQTLNRQTLKKPEVERLAQGHPPVQRSAAISKFAPHPSAPMQRSRKPLMQDIAPQAHPSALKAHAIQTQKKQSATLATQPHNPSPAQVIKRQAIADAMDATPKKTAQSHKSPARPRRFSIATASLALVLLGGYLTYINLPSLSVRVAAAQAGIDASYPQYHPDGYSLKGAVAYKEGQVSMDFVANAGPQNFTVTQSKSSYDSSAVLDNYIKPKVGDQYMTYNERGLTIYTYGGNAAWVSGGILYTINGNAPLSGDQIRHIATSM